MKMFKRVLAWVFGSVVVLFTVALLVLRMPVFGGTIEGAQLDRIRQSPQFTGGRFENTPPQESLDVNKLQTMINNYMGGQVRDPQFEIPVLIVSDEDFKDAALGGPTTPAGKRVQLFNMPGSEVGPGDGPATWGKATANTVNAFDYQWDWADKSSKHTPFDWVGP